MDLSQFYQDNSCWVILQFTVERNGLDLHIKNRINRISVDFVMALLMELWECNMEMAHNEGMEASYRRRESDITPAWIDQDNALAVHIQQNVIEGTTSSPNIDVIASSPDLQWFLQSSLLSQSETAMGTFSSFIPTSMSNCSCLSQCSSPDQFCIGAVGHGLVGHTNMHMSSEELEKIRIRRERNRVAAARCRDRRRVLIDTLQNETDHLEHVKAKLEEEIAALERERERLELVFEAHVPICKLKEPNPE